MLKKVNKILIIFLVFITFIALNSVKSQAVLQSNGNSPARYNLSDYIMNVRKMEQLGGAMGLAETVNSNLTSSTSNGIDVHMEKNTEYGAMAILSASSYGNPNKINDGETTTGNITGVVMKLNREWVAASTNNNNATNFYNAQGRYKNIYADSASLNLRGDAGAETTGWHGSGVSNVLRYNLGQAGLARACSGSIFSYDGFIEKNWQSGGFNGRAWTETNPTRAVIVVGEGL